MSRILLVEDDASMQAGLRDNLEIESYEVDVAGDGVTGLELLVTGGYDLAILDVMLPKMSGFDLLRKARDQGIATPVIMLTARGEEIDRVLGLELGADDYVSKPFSLRELLARVKAVLRRAERPAQTKMEEMLTLGTLTVDFTTYNATRGEKAVAMTPKEFDVLKFLWLHKGETVSRDQLLTEVWGYNDTITSRTVDNFILRLRQKVEEDPAHPKHILTMHGIGYKLIP